MIASISGMLPSEVVVLRDGNWKAIPALDLVPGDIVQIRAGNKIPADLRLCEVSSDLKFNRSILTGEAKPVKGSIYTTSDNFLEVSICFCRTDIRQIILRCKAHIVSQGLESGFASLRETIPSLER